MATPIVKWVGGKAKLLPQLAPLLPRPLDIHYYAEPFVGGGAMLFYMAKHWPADRKRLFRWHINDTNDDLISFYGAVACYSDVVADVACRFAAQHSPESFKRARELFNSLRPFVRDRSLCNSAMHALHAGLFLYLNKCGFNGLYRTNRAGKFNVAANPDAKWRPKLDALKDELLFAGCVLNSCTRTTHRYDVFIDEQIKHSINTIEPEHVFFFVDPPYINGDQDGFTGYGPERWAEGDLLLLSLCVQQIHEAGARFMLTHVDTPLARELFNHAAYFVTTVTTAQTISTTAAGRVPRTELVIRNYR